MGFITDGSGSLVWQPDTSTGSGMSYAPIQHSPLSQGMSGWGNQSSIPLNQLDQATTNAYQSLGSYGVGASSNAPAELSWLDKMIGTKDQPGWGGLALGGAQFLGNAFMGMKQYGLASDAFNESKKQFSMNYDAQKGLTNSQLADRQARRIKEGRATGTVDDYMSKYGVK